MRRIALLLFAATVLVVAGCRTPDARPGISLSITVNFPAEKGK